MKKQNLKDIIYICIENILTRDNKKYAKLKEIYEEVSRYLEIENNEILQSQIRGRLQEHSKQYPTSFNGESLFFTEKVRSGNWTIKKDEIKYIRYIKNKYLISVDDWDTIKTVSVIDSSYVLEENLDNIYKAKLVKLVGSDKANVIINELNDIRILLKDYMHISKTNDGYGTAFEIFSISTIYNIDYIECMKKYIINGDYDGSIDAIYYNDPNYVYIYQIKTNELNDDVYNKMELNYNKCFNNENNSVYKDLYNYITKNKDNLKRKIPKFRSISTNCKKNTNLTPEQIYNMFFKNKLLPIRNNGLSLLIPKPIFETSNGCQYNVSTDGYGNFSFYIKACELINSLLDALGSSLNSYTTKDFSKYFYDNVRGVLSTNKKMIYTIENEPENFLKYNNGINITGEVLDLKNEILIKDPIINNGQQTITTLISHNKNLNKILLPIKITNETNLVIKSKISRFSNEQVKVKSIDMLSLNEYIRKIQEIIFDNEYNCQKYYLKIYSSGKKSYYNIIEKIYNKNNIIDLLDFIKLYFSIINNKDLGCWKNSPNTQIEKTLIDKDFDTTISFKVCEAICNYENYIDNIDNKKIKDDLKSADLAFKYLLCKENLSCDEAFSIINNINYKYFYKCPTDKSKLIDIYKSSSIINKIDKEIKIFKNNNKKIKQNV